MVEALRSLTRTSSVDEDLFSADIRRLAQRVLIIAPTDGSARHVASLLATNLLSSRLILFVSARFRSEWPNVDYTRLRNGGYTFGQVGADCRNHDGGVDDDGGVAATSNDRDVVVCTSHFVMATKQRLILRHRQTVIIDDANMVRNNDMRNVASCDDIVSAMREL